MVVWTFNTISLMVFVSSFIIRFLA